MTKANSMAKVTYAGKEEAAYLVLHRRGCAFQKGIQPRLILKEEQRVGG